MSSFHVTNNSALNGLIIKQVEQKRVRTIGNFNPNGAPFTTTATSSSAKISMKSTAEGKSVVSSISMSMERKDAIQYLPRKIPQCVLPAGQSTVIHLDNYTNFMAHRVTTKTAYKRAEIISEEHKPIIVPCPTTSYNSSGAGVADVDLKVILNDVNLSHHSNNKILDMNKQKLLGSKSLTPSKIRGRKKALLALECKKPTEGNKMIDMKTDKPDTSTMLKPNKSKKPKVNRRKKVIKPRKTRKSKIKTKAGAANTNDEDSDKEVVKDLQSVSHNQLPTSGNKILRPCVYTLQSTKCLSEMTCPYLHSDFPCKYYYLNLHCPKGFKCQFMHNGPLEPKLIEALKNHILDLLSTKPSTVETHFIQQMYNIEDLLQRLQSFQKNQDQSNEIIEVFDDDDDDINQELVTGTSGIDVDFNNFNDQANTLNETIISSVLQPTSDKLDIVYKNFKETNSIIDEVDKKLKNLKTKSDMTPNQKIHELQNIYDILKEQEKILPIYESINTATTTTTTATTTEQITRACDSTENTSYPLPTTTTTAIESHQPHIVLVNPDIINDIQTSVYEEIGVALTDDENTITIAEHDSLKDTNSNLRQIPGTEFPTVEELSEEGGIEELPQYASESSKEPTCFGKEGEVNDLNESFNLIYEEEEPETILSHSNSKVRENDEKPEQIINKNNPFVSSKPLECDTHYTIEENIDKNMSLALDKDEKIDEKLELQNETLQLDITNGEKEFIENNINDMIMIDDQSPPYEDITTGKPVKRDRIRLRSHTLQQDNEENTNNLDSEKTIATTLEPPTKPIRTRRLRLPKPSQKTIEKSNIEECQINADVINKLINSTENNESREKIHKETTSCLQDLEIPLTQNIIFTKRYIKKAKAKLQQSNETEETACKNELNSNVEQKLSALHSGNIKNMDNSIENIDVSLLTQTSEDSNFSKHSQDPLTMNSNCDNVNNIDNDMPTSSQNVDNVKLTKNDNRKNGSVNFKLPPIDIEKCETLNNQSFKRRISFENPTSSLVSSLPSSIIKGQFILGNPHVVLTKLKTPLLMSTKTQRDVQADSTTSYVNPIVTSSTLLADDKSTQKRPSFSSEYDLDSSLKGNKCLKIDHSKSVRTVKIESRKRKHSDQSIDSKDDDDGFETDSCDEKLTIVDALQTSSGNNNEQSEIFETSSTHVAIQQHQHSHQQIENVCNKSNSQLQIEQHKQQQQEEEDDEVERTSTTIVRSFKTKTGNNWPHKQYEKQENELGLLEQREEKKEEEVIDYKKSEQIAKTYDSNKKDEDEHECTQSLSFKRIDEPEELTSTSCNKYPSETAVTEKEINVEYSTHSSLFNKLSKHATKCQINFENSSVNITPISSPTYGDNTIASPSPVRKLIDFRMGGEVDGRLTYPPIPYILHEIDLGKIDINKPLCIDKLKKTIQLDPRIFRTQVKKQIMTLYKPPVETTSNALVPIATSTTLNYSHDSSFYGQPTASMIAAPCDPRSRTSAIMPDIATPSLSHQTALTPYNSLQTVAATSPSSSFMHTGIPNSIPLALQYHSTPQPIIQPQQQQTPNMFLYGCLQRSPWYQSLMSTVKIQINQSISQLVRALNNFHRERLLNPELVFDVFKIDCAGELLEIMRNLGVFIDANGIINEQRHVPSFGGRSCCNAMPVNATYSFIQQVLTPNTQCTSLTTASSTYNAAGGTPVGQLNVHEPFVSCYIKAPEPVQKPAEDSATTNNSQHDDNNSYRNYNNNNRNDCNNNNYNNNNQNDNRRYGGNQFRKPYDKSNGNNNNYQQRSNQRYNNYNNNPRFMKPGSCSPTKSSSSPPNSPRNGEGSNGGGSYGGGSYGGGRGGRGGGGGRFNNNKRFNNYNDNDSKNNGSSSWASSSDSNDNRYNNKYQSNSSPPRNSSPNSSYQPGSPKASSSPPKAPLKKDSNDEECWDSDN